MIPSEMDEGITILCTRALPEVLVEYASTKGIRICCEPFIITEPVDELEVQQEVETISLLETTVIFTSAKAVEIVSDYIFSKPEGWRIFCIGHGTKEALENSLGAGLVAGTADDGAGLARKIIEAGADEAFFFCGDKRLETIPNMMKQQDIMLTEVVVYRTIEVPHKISFNYAGVMLFTPSAVRSYFTMNKPSDHLIFFCLGNTTADEVRKFAGNRIIIPESPTASEIVEEVIEFYT